MTAKRNYDDPEYKRFRNKVLKRDKKQCQMCKSKKRLQVHHIMKWSSASSLRYDESNGITLCYCCHKQITGKESSYVEYFSQIVRRNTK
jgi:5-methylcytosine-specific restriction endonuclease McrA